MLKELNHNLKGDSELGWLEVAAAGGGTKGKVACVVDQDPRFQDQQDEGIRV